jgi:hypothetical protein
MGGRQATPTHARNTPASHPRDVTTPPPDPLAFWQIVQITIAPFTMQSPTWTVGGISTMPPGIAPRAGTPYWPTTPRNADWDQSVQFPISASSILSLHERPRGFELSVQEVLLQF